MSLRKLLILGLPLLLLAGCGKSFEAAVDGVVTLDGKPLDTGTVAFYPLQGGPAAYSRIQPDGRYSIVTGRRGGLPVGEYAVTVVATAPPPNPKLEVPGKLITPPRYGQPDRSGLRFTVKPGHNSIDLALASP